MMKQLWSAVSVIAMVLVAGAAGADEEFRSPDKKQFYLMPGIGYYSAPDGIGVDDGDIAPALGIGYGFTERLAGELLLMRGDMDYNLPGGTGSDDADLAWLNLLYKLPAKGPWQPFVTVGGGKTEISFDGLQKKFDDNQFNLGLGVFGSLSNRFALRGDIRGVYSNEEGGLEPFAMVGLTAFLGNVTPPAPVDTDGDGVPDKDDKCPNTRPGADVDADGCEIDGDADGDGVKDSMDRCPDTPRGVAVDSRGCPLDSDGDGVPDYMDECPDTAAGAKVDEKGCYVELEETVTIDLNLEFDTNSADLRPAHYSEIGEVVAFLRQYPTANVVIEGHTDSRGTDAYNQGLSERRAKSVHDYLVSQGIAASRLSSAGFGESRPIDTNDTDEGRQHNRRVSAQVSGKQTVRQ